MTEEPTVPEPIDYLAKLGTDLRAAAVRHQGPTRRVQRRAAIAIVSAVVAVVVAATFGLVDRSAGRSQRASSHPPSNAPRNALANQGPVEFVDGTGLSAISATGPNNIWVLGASRTPHRYQRFVLHYDGISWRRMAVPPQRDTSIGIAALSPTDVWIATEDMTEGALHWDGARWTRVPLPTVPDINDTQLLAMGGSGPNDLWIVGKQDGVRIRDDNSVGNHTLALHWDGSHWSVVTSPNPARKYDELTSVLAISPSNAWAVGSSEHRGFLLHWDGRHWTDTPAEALPGNIASLLGVGGGRNGPVWAVGRTRAGRSQNGYGNPVYLRRQGARWQQVPAPPSTGDTTVPDQVSASSPTDAWGIGCQCSSGSLVARYTFGLWHDMTVPLPSGAVYTSFNPSGIVDLSPTDAWLVGTADRYQYGASATTESSVAVLDHWDGSSWSAARPSP